MGLGKQSHLLRMGLERIGLGKQSHLLRMGLGKAVTLTKNRAWKSSHIYYGWGSEKQPHLLWMGLGKAVRFTMDETCKVVTFTREGA